MHKEFFDTVTPFSKLIIIFLLIIMLFITNSIYIILFITILTVYLMILINKSVNFYIKIFKNYLLLLLFLLLIYIIFLRSNIILFTCKLIISTLLFSIYFIYVNFSELNLVIYKLLIPLKYVGVNIQNVSYNITIYLYYINYLFSSNTEIIKKQQLKSNKKYNLKYLFLPALIYADDKTRKLNTNLKLNYYKLIYKKENKTSLFILLFFIILFILTLIRR